MLKILKIKKVMVCINRSSSLPHKTLSLKCLSDFVTAQYLTMSHHNLYIAASLAIRIDLAQVFCYC